jgi:hypothetical protein
VEFALLAQPAGESAVRPNDAQERPYWLETAKSHIAECEVFPTDDPQRPLKLHPQPVFHHVQSTRGRSVGSVFLFVDAGGRPAAVGDVFMFLKGNQHQLYNEWHSLVARSDFRMTGLLPISTRRWRVPSLFGGTPSAFRHLVTVWPVTPNSRATV